MCSAQRGPVKSGSSVAIYRSRRCGFRPACCHARCTATLVTPNVAASLRQLQRVEPSFGRLRVAARIWARSFGVSTEADCPGWLVSRASIPEARKRWLRRLMVGVVVLTFCLIVLNLAPSASIRMSRARKTYPAGRERDWAVRLSSKYWVWLSTTESMDTPASREEHLAEFALRDLLEVLYSQQHVGRDGHPARLAERERLGARAGAGHRG